MAIIDGRPGPNKEPPRRRRRTREDIEKRLCDAARQLFAQRGYAATTTREIAELADVSETLLFRYYGDKATLFNEVATAPFRRLMAEFVSLHAQPAAPFPDLTETRRFIRKMFELVEQNAEIFRAVILGTTPLANRVAPLGLDGLLTFLEDSTSQLERLYATAGVDPPIDLRIGVRLSFGMIVASVALRDSLFPDVSLDRARLIAAVEHMIASSLFHVPD